MLKRKPTAWETIFRLVKRVPKGRVITYGQLARAGKLRGGARAAGYAMAACPKGRGIPWHRVIGAGGRILLSEPRAALQRRLLESEGIEFRGARLELQGREWFPPAPRKRPHRAPR
jgi:methylated-DNA-protein-cysteine methyltransferase-like protein